MDVEEIYFDFELDDVSPNESIVGAQSPPEFTHADNIRDIKIKFEQLGVRNMHVERNARKALLATGIP